MKLYMVSPALNGTFEGMYSSDFVEGGIVIGFGTQLIEKYISKNFLELNLGLIHFQLLNENPYLAVLQNIDNDIYKVINIVHSEFDSRCVSYWFVKDHSINVHEIYAFSDNGRAIVDIGNMLMSNSEGKYRDTVFSKNELNESLKFYYALARLNTIKNTDNKVKNTEDTIQLG